ncbi:hypothetical protein V6448_001849 [Vibrio vulnificus]|nr:hypothetical protein [Vibrio vulnificus]
MAALALTRPDTEEVVPNDSANVSTFMKQSAAHEITVQDSLVKTSDKSSKLETAPVHGSELLKSSTRVIEQVKTKTKLIVEADYYGVINKVDVKDNTLSATIYDKIENVFLMEVDIPFSEFEKRDHCLFKENSVFYWQIGKKEQYKPNKLGSIKRSQTNFSSLRMRRVFVDMRQQDKRIQFLSNKYKNIFQRD